MSDFGNQPWTTFHSPGEEYFAVLDGEGNEIVTLYYGNLGDDPQPGGRALAQRRAKLFRAAPELLYFLIEAVAEIEALRPVCDCRDREAPVCLIHDQIRFLLAGLDLPEAPR